VIKKIKNKKNKKNLWRGVGDKKTTLLFFKIEFKFIIIIVMYLSLV